MKIDAPKAYSAEDDAANPRLFPWADETKTGEVVVPVRIVRESDWRKIMAVMKAVDRYWPDEIFSSAPDVIHFPLSDLRRHLEKRK